MDKEWLRLLLERVRTGEVPVDGALDELKAFPYEDLGFAKIDHHRALRSGYPEVIYCAGKTPAQVQAIMQRLVPYNRNVLATRASETVYQAVAEVLPLAIYHSTARIIEYKSCPRQEKGTVLVITAGTADLPVAEEAAIAARAMGHRVLTLYDVGVAGIHRLLDRQDLFEEAQVLIVAAGMEGALASVVAGLVDKPVVAVPTSTGYGASFHGLAALLTMLNSCASGIGVVNIDNGFGAAALASAIIKSGEKA